MRNAQINKQTLRATGINPCLFPVIMAKAEESQAAKEQLSDIGFLKLDTKGGDVADRANNDRVIEERNRRIMTLQLKYRKLDALLDILMDPDYDGYCTVCGDNVPGKRVIDFNSTLCLSCAQSTEIG